MNELFAWRLCDLAVKKVINLKMNNRPDHCIMNQRKRVHLIIIRTAFENAIAEFETDAVRRLVFQRGQHILGPTLGSCRRITVQQ